MKTYQLFAGMCEQHVYTLPSTNGRDASKWIRKFYKIQRTDRFRICRLPRRGGYPSSMRHYNIIEIRRRLYGQKTERVINSFCLRIEDTLT